MQRSSRRSSPRTGCTRTSWSGGAARDGLVAAARDVLKTDPLSVHVFAFCNRRRDRIKLLAFARSGFWHCAKRLERGPFALPVAPDGVARVECRTADFALLLSGVDPVRASRRKWWTRDCGGPAENQSPFSAPAAGVLVPTGAASDAPTPSSSSVSELAALRARLAAETAARAAAESVVGELRARLRRFEDERDAVRCRRGSTNRCGTSIVGRPTRSTPTRSSGRSQPSSADLVARSRRPAALRRPTTSRSPRARACGGR